MLVEQIKRNIEDYASRLQASHPLMLRARDGALPAAAVAAHVNNIRFSIRCAYRHMRRCRARALELGLEDLARFLEQKIREEYGHDKWADQDLQRIRSDYEVEPGEPSLATAELMLYLDEAIERDPRCYLAYMFFLEYLTVLAGPAFVGAIEDNCGIPASHVSVVALHVELDKTHVAEAVSQLTELTEGADVELLRRVLKRSMDCFERSCSDVSLVAA